MHLVPWFTCRRRMAAESASALTRHATKRWAVELATCLAAEISFSSLQLPWTIALAASLRLWVAAATIRAYNRQTDIVTHCDTLWHIHCDTPWHSQTHTVWTRSTQQAHSRVLRRLVGAVWGVTHCRDESFWPLTVLLQVPRHRPDLNTQ